MSLSTFNAAVLPQLRGAEALVAGVDEVGRGALFGPVVAAAIAAPLSIHPQLTQIGVTDSKLLSPPRRCELAQQIKATTSWKISYATVKEIDTLNILQASLRAMQRAVISLQEPPTFCFVDGKQVLPGLTIPQLALIKGDRRSSVVAAASIIAKVWRDELIERLATKYPHYDLAANKGYGTQRHRLALQRYGPSPLHRRSFRPCRHNGLH